MITVMLNFSPLCFVFIWINETIDEIVGISKTGEKCMYVRDQVIGAEQ